MIYSSEELMNYLVCACDYDPADVSDYIGSFLRNKEYPITNDELREIEEGFCDWAGLDMNESTVMYESTLNEGWSSCYDWKSADDVKEALKFDEISSDYEFITNFGNFFCYKRKKDGYPICDYYLIKSFGKNNGYGYKAVSACYSETYNAKAAKWLKNALLDYGSTPENPGDFKDSWEWIEKAKDEVERPDYKNILKPGDKVKYGDSIVVYERPYNNQAFAGHVEGEYITYKWYYRNISELINESTTLTEGFGMGNLTVGYLKNILQDAIDYLDDYEDEDIVTCHSNTYGLRAPMLETRYGFVELDNLDIEFNDDEEE